jgi:hypothetical protein
MVRPAGPAVVDEQSVAGQIQCGPGEIRCHGVHGGHDASAVVTFAVDDQQWIAGGSAGAAGPGDQAEHPATLKDRADHVDTIEADF